MLIDKLEYFRRIAWGKSNIARILMRDIISYNQAEEARNYLANIPEEERKKYSDDIQRKLDESNLQLIQENEEKKKRKKENGQNFDNVSI